MKNSSRAAPTNKQGWFCRCWCPELIHIQGSGLPVPEDTAGMQSTTSHTLLETPGAPHSSSIRLQANISWGRKTLSPAPKIIAAASKVHPCWCILAQGYKKHSSFCSPSPKISQTGCSINTRARGACCSSGCILWLDSLQSGKAEPLPGGFLIIQDIYRVSLAISLCLLILQRSAWAFHWNFWSWPSIILLAKFPVKGTFMRQLTLRQLQEELQGTWLELTAKSHQVYRWNYRESRFHCLK